MFPIRNTRTELKRKGIEQREIQRQREVGRCQYWFLMEDRDHKDRALKDNGLKETSEVELPKGMHTDGFERRSYNPYRAWPEGGSLRS